MDMGQFFDRPGDEGFRIVGQWSEALSGIPLEPKLHLGFPKGPKYLDMRYVVGFLHEDSCF